MLLREDVQEWLKKGIHFLFPSICLTCHQDLSSPHRQSVCLDCLRNIEFNPETSNNYSYLDSLYSATLFKGVMRDLLHLYKYQGKDYLTPMLVDLWTRYWAPPTASIDVIVPVPMPFWREIHRGYNQATLLAVELGKRWNIPVQTRPLRRQQSFSQTQLSKDKRQKNAAKSFSLNPEGSLTPSSHVLLVDDITTTGSTLNSCAKLLKMARVSKVFGSTLARETLN